MHHQIIISTYNYLQILVAKKLLATKVTF